MVDPVFETLSRKRPCNRTIVKILVCHVNILGDGYLVGLHQPPAIHGTEATRHTRTPYPVQ